MRSRQETKRNIGWSQKPVSGNRNGTDDMLLKTVDAGLAAIVFVTPFLFGGRHPLGQFVFVTLCCLIGLTWFLRQSLSTDGRWTRTTAIWLLILAVACTAFQVVALPKGWTTAVAPRLQTLLPLWFQDASGSLGFGSWDTISIAPAETRQAIAILFAYVLLFVTASQRLATKSDIQRIMKWIGFSVVAAAVFGIVQYMTSNGRFFWCYEYPYTGTFTDVNGSFTNRNHFAHFLVLGIGPLVAFFLNRISRNSPRHNAPENGGQSHRSSASVSVLFCLASLLVVSAVLLTRSRGGCLALGTVLIVIGAIYLHFRIISVSSLGIVFSVSIVLVVAIMSLYGYDRVANRLDDLATGSVEDLDVAGGRRTIWKANLASIQSGWTTGSGAGTHRYIYPAYATEPNAKVFTHAENGYLQIATENGLPGALLLLSIVSCCAVWCFQALSKSQTNSERLLAGAITAALLASLVHSVVDFVWYVPACMAVTILLAACALRLSQLTQPEEARSRQSIMLKRPVWIGFAVVACLASFWACSQLIGPARASLHWDRYQLSAIALKKVHAAPIDQQANDERESEQAEYELTRYMVDELSKVVIADPQYARAHLKLAHSLLRLFDLQQRQALNQMNVAQIREAAIASQFANSHQLRQWLERALGEQSKILYRALYHTKRVIDLSPTQGEAYTLLADLCFLEGHNSAFVDACFEQALAVCPVDGDVIYAAGMHRLTSGDIAEATEIWRPLLQVDTHYRTIVVNLLARQFPAEVLLSALQPGISSLTSVWNSYRQVGNQEDWQAIAQYVGQLIQQHRTEDESDDLFPHWQLLARIHSSLERHDAALACYQHAYRLKPSDFSLRYEMGVTLTKTGSLDEAEEHLRWCQTRRPAHVGTEHYLKQIGKLRVTRREPAGSNTTIGR